jgi:hypothetical protein
MAMAVAHLLGHPDEAAGMAQAARAWLGDRFDDQTLGQALVAAYTASPTRPRTEQETPCR